MRSLRLFGLIASCGVLLAGEHWTIDTLLNLPTLHDPQIRSDGQVYSFTRRTLEGGEWRSAVWVAPIASGEARMVGRGSHARWAPQGSRLAFLDKEVHLYDADRHSSTVVTHSGARVSTFWWTPDGRSIAYLAVDSAPLPDPIVADRDYRYSRLYIQRIDDREPRLLTRRDCHVLSAAFSPDGKRVVYAAQPTPRNRDSFDVDLYELDLADMTEKALVTQPGRDADPSYSPDGKLIAFHSQGGTLNYFAARHVGLVPSGGGKIRYLTEHTDVPLDVFRGGDAFSWSPDSKTLYYNAGHSVRDYLMRQDIATGRVERVTDHIASAASFTPDLSRAVFVKSDPSRPAEIVLLAGRDEKTLTNIGAAVANLPAVHSKVISWKSRDGLPVEGVLLLPFQYQAGHPVPLLVELHGGPTGVALDSFPVPRTYPTQCFLEQGFAVLAPNFRGSVNYGAEFRLKNIESQGFGDFDDVMTGVDFLIKEGVADPKRLGVMGWSYGGFLTAWVIGHTDRFKAASVGAPATDWITYYGQSDGPRSTLLTYFGGNPWEKPENYSKHSPRTGIAKIQTPTLLQIGGMDINHNSEIYWSLTDRNIPVEYVIYPREGHGIAEPAHQRDLMERNLRWFTKWLQ